MAVVEPVSKMLFRLLLPLAFMLQGSQGMSPTMMPTVPAAANLYVGPLNTSCASNGKLPLMTLYDCEEAAINLGLEFEGSIVSPNFDLPFCSKTLSSGRPIVVYNFAPAPQTPAYKENSQPICSALSIEQPLDCTTAVLPDIVDDKDAFIDFSSTFSSLDYQNLSASGQLSFLPSFHRAVAAGANVGMEFVEVYCADLSSPTIIATRVLFSQSPDNTAAVREFETLITTNPSVVFNPANTFDSNFYGVPICETLKIKESGGEVENGGSDDGDGDDGVSQAVLIAAIVIPVGLLLLIAIITAMCCCCGRTKPNAKKKSSTAGKKEEEKKEDIAVEAEEVGEVDNHRQDAGDV